MKIFKSVVVALFFLAGIAQAQFSFYLIDNYESGLQDKWYRFGQAAISVEANPSLEAEANDTITESCGDFSLSVKGSTQNWYIGGLGADLNADASAYTRLQMDVFGSSHPGKIKIEIFDDDNSNFSLEQDPAHDWVATKDDKWIAEVPVLGKGWTRISIPFTAFRLENPGSGDGLWNPDQNGGSAGILKVQLVFLSDQPTGEVEAKLDNILLTY